MQQRGNMLSLVFGVKKKKKKKKKKTQSGKKCAYQSSTKGDYVGKYTSSVHA